MTLSWRFLCLGMVFKVNLANCLISLHLACELMDLSLSMNMDVNLYLNVICSSYLY